MSSFVDDAAELRAAYAAARGLLRARNAFAARRVVLTLCHALGAGVSSADTDMPDAVPMDISLGEGPPLLPVTGDPRVLALLMRYLAPAVLDARLVVERGHAADRLLQMATIDVLTGVWARQSLMFAINHAQRGDCVALIDLDHFKTINDTLGHHAGDTALADFGAHLRGAVRERDIVGRYGGEEFVVLLPATALGEASDVLGRLRESWLASSFVPVTFSAGIAMVTESETDGDHGGQMAVKAADTLMYEAKAAGRDRVACQPTAPHGGALTEGAGA